MSKYIAYITPYKNTVIIDYREMFGDDGVLDDCVTMMLDVLNSNTEEFMTYVEGRLFVNGVKYKKTSTQIEDGKFVMECHSEPYIFSIRIDSDSDLYCDGKLRLEFKGTENVVELYVSTSDVQEIGDYALDAHIINGRMNTFMLMRTDPKLTGNIKLVVDSENHLYLDTFKASSVLNNRIYRKYPVSSDGNYPRDVMTVFSNLPKSELFKTPADSLNPHKYYSDFKKQYVTDYEYGAETNSDNMYSENMKILAPLHIGKNVPDFFCVFRYDGVYNEDTYHSADIDDTSVFEKLLKTAEVVKIFDLRNYTTAGKYIHNYCELLNQYLHGSCYLQFIEQDNDKNSNNYRQGNNSWRGIDVAHGLITNKIESSYFANNILESDDCVQEKFNDYIINGYERNNLLYPYILNMEFMFNDMTSDEFKMNRYYGLYLTSNEFQKYQCIITDTTSDDNRSIKLDDNDEEVFDDALISHTISVTDFADRIFFMTTNNDAARVQSEDDVKMFIDKYVLDNPDVNISNIKSVPVEWEDNDKSFISITFKNPVYYGEHLRFVCPNHITEQDSELENICLEIVASNDERLLTEDSYISPYVLTNFPDKVYETADNDVKTSFYRIAFYSQSVTDSQVAATVPEQIERIRAAITRFSSFIRVTSYDDDTLCVVSCCDTTYFQHILPVNKYTEPEFCQMYVVKDGEKYDLHYTKLNNDKSDYDSYITKIKKILSQKLTSNDCPDYSGDAYEGKFYTDESGVNHVVNYVEYESSVNTMTDTLRYFSKTSESMMYVLSPDTETYSSMYMALSMFGFDNLGWRYSAIIPFKKTTDFLWPYAVYDDMDVILKYTKHPLVKSIDGHFETIKQQYVSVDYLTDNAIMMLGASGLDIQTQRLISTSSLKNTIISPYNCKSVLIDFKTQPFSHNSEIALFNPESAALCAMGIMSVKDIDMRINYEEDIVISNKKSVTISSGDVVCVGSLTDNRIMKDCVYRITAGSFIEFPMKEFIMSGKEIRYTIDGKNIVTDTFNSGILTASGDVTIEMIDGSESSVFVTDVKSAIPTQNDENLFKNKTDLSSSYLNVSIVPQTNCLWMSNGLYFDGNAILDTDELTNISYVPGGHFTELASSPSLDNGGNSFVKNSVNSYAHSFNTGIVKFRDLIKTASIQNIIKKMIIQNGMPDTAVGYYNSYVQTLEFVYYGIKFGLKFNSDYYNQNIHIGEYNNFDVYFINEPDFSDENEMFISVDEQIIVFVNHRFDMSIDCGKQYYSQINCVDDGNGIVCENDYRAYRAPYSIEPDSVCGFNNAFIASKTNGMSVKFDDTVIESYFVQEDHATKEFSDNGNVYPNYTFFRIYDQTDDWTTDNDIFNINKPVAGILRYTAQDKYITDKFSNEENLNVLDKDLTVYGNRMSESYIVDIHSYEETDDSSNASSSISGSERLKKYISSINGNVRCYIVKNNSVNEMVITDNYKPLSITMQRPSRIKYNFGYFIPRFYDVVKFDTNDYDLSEATGMNMLLGNTNVQKIERINTYTGNKIFTGTDEFAVLKNYFITHHRSVMSSNWDMGYYRQYTDNDKYSLLNGYIPGIEDKSFFGSRCLVLKNQYIELDDFSAPRINPRVEYLDSVHNMYSENRIQCKVIINITQSIYSKFENEPTFVDNWNNNDFSKEQMSTAIGNYIQNSISEIYNIQRKREVIVYRKHNTDSSDMNVEFKASPDGYDDWEVIGDYNAQMTTESNEMILTITLSIEQGYTIHPFVKIYRN